MVKIRLFNKKGQGVQGAWTYGLVSIFGLGLVYIIFDKILVEDVRGTMISIANNTMSSSELNAYIANIDKFFTIWNILPFVLIFSVIIYMVIVGVRKERINEGRF